jgi:tetratricopeptide (TPR) repeat protein
MIKIIAIGIVAAVTTVDAHIFTFTTRPDKKEFGFFEPIEVTSEIRVSGNSLRRAYPEGISGNVVYEVEYELRGTFLPLAQNLHGAGPHLWGAKVEDVTIDNAPLIGTMDLRILFEFKAGRYRVRGKYRSDSQSSTFEKVSDWSEFEIKPPTEREAIIFEEFQTAGVGNTDAEQLASYEAFAAKYPTDHITARVYREILHFYLKTGDQGRALDFLKKVINNPNISKLKRRLFAYEIGGLEEKSGRVDEAIRWYRQSGLRNGEERIEKLQGKHHATAR